MIRVIDYVLRENSKGEEFFALYLMGGVEMVQSQETGRYYATARKCSMPSTFDEATCKSLIGSMYPGSIHKIQCDPYGYTIKETGEIIKLNFRWEYSPEEASIEEAVHEGKVVQPVQN